MRIMSVNIEGSRHLERISRLLDEREPDVVCVQELFERDLALLSDRFAHVSYVPMVLQRQDGNGYAPKGLGFASHALFDPIRHRYAGPEQLREYVSMDEARMQRWLFGGVINGVSIVTTHMMVTADASIEEFQYRDTHAVIDTLSDRDRVVLCGDMNAPRGGPIFGMLAEAFEDTVPVEADTTIDNDLHRAAPLSLVVDGAFTRGVDASVELVFGVSDHAGLVIETFE